jgi:hypothetical protein
MAAVEIAAAEKRTAQISGAVRMMASMACRDLSRKAPAERPQSRGRSQSEVGQIHRAYGGERLAQGSPLG